MLLWICFAILTAAAVAALARGLGYGSDKALDSREADLAVYRDQLSEIDRERDEGLLQPAEAEVARAEVARRMLARAEGQGGVSPDGDAAARSRSLDRLRMAAMAVVPLLSIALYMYFGAPSLPDQPHAQRSAAKPEASKVGDLIAKVEERLKQHPEDAQGWEVLGPVYLLQQRYDDASEAFRNSIKLSGESPKRLWGLAQALIGAKEGLVTEEARRALDKLVAQDPSRLEARFWLAAAKEQDGKTEAAVADYRAILAAAPAGAPWRSAVEGRLAALDPSAKVPGTAAQQPAASAQSPDSRGPTERDVAEAQRMSPAAQAEMVDKMVGGLAERLQKNGRDLAGWQKLIRAYKVLGRDAEASKALAAARTNFSGDVPALGELDTLAKSLGLGG